MSSKKNVTMCDNLFKLCEQQLHSVLDETEAAIVKVTNSTREALKMSTTLSEMIHVSDSEQNVELELCSDLEKSFNKVLTNMQFFDEFSQRIQHIEQVVDLIRVESNREGFLSDQKDSQKLFTEIQNIFSIRSEFEVLRNIFPEYEVSSNTQEIELF